MWDLRNGSRTLAIDPPQVSCGPDAACPGVFKVDLSDDASFLATADGEGLAHVWDLGSAQRDPHRPRDIPPAGLAGRGVARGKLRRSLRREGGTAGRPQSGRAVPRDRRERRHGPDLGHRGRTAAVERRSLRTRNRSLLRAGDTRDPEVQSRWNPPVLRALRWAQGERRRHHDGDHVPLTAPSVPGCDERLRLPARLQVGYGRRTQIEFFGADRVVLARFQENDVRLDAGANDAQLDEGPDAAGSHVADHLGGVQRRRHTIRDRKPRRDRPGVGHVNGGTHLHVAGRTERRCSGRVQSRTGLGSRRSTRMAGSSCYPIPCEDAIEIAEARVTRGLTDEECRRYLHVPSCPAD